MERFDSAAAVVIVVVCRVFRVPCGPQNVVSSKKQCPALFLFKSAPFCAKHTSRVVLKVYVATKRVTARKRTW